jgi:hypothetical protein
VAHAAQSIILETTSNRVMGLQIRGRCSSLETCLRAALLLVLAPSLLTH